MRHRSRRFVAIHGDSNEFGTGARKRRDLSHRRLDIGGVGVGHRLYDDRRAAADDDGPLAFADAHAHAGAALARSKGDIGIGLMHRHGSRP